MWRQNTTTPTWKAFLHSLVQRICPGPPKGHATSQRWCHCLLEMTAKEKENSRHGLLFQVRNKEIMGTVQYLFLFCVTPPISWFFLKHMELYRDFAILFFFLFPSGFTCDSLLACTHIHCYCLLFYGLYVVYRGFYAGHSHQSI